jgi:two-component system, OmpR family, alkaline phosphatase synthesis response regulator PhoP
MTQVLIVEDEDDITTLIHFNLTKNGYSVLHAKDGESALNLIKKHSPEVVILDWMIPKIDGIDVCRMVKSDNSLSSTGILMLSAKSEEFDKVLALEVGADDYLSKPFSPRELMARVKALCRRVIPLREALSSSDKIQDILIFGQLTINGATFEASINEQPLNLTKTEFDLLFFLASTPSRAYTRKQLLYELWDENHHGDSRVVDVHIRKLRAKLEQKSSTPYILTIRGVGYRFNSDLLK